MLTVPRCELLAAKYLSKQEAGSRLFGIANLAARYASNRAIMAHGSMRRDDLSRTAKAIEKARKAFLKIDPIGRVQALARGKSSLGEDGVEDNHPHENASVCPLSTPPFLLFAEVDAFLQIAEHLEGGLNALADSEVVTKGRDPVPDPILFAVEQLADLWAHFRGAPPTQSKNRDGFAALCVELLSVPPAAFPEDTVRGAALKIASGRRATVAMHTRARPPSKTA